METIVSVLSLSDARHANTCAPLRRCSAVHASPVAHARSPLLHLCPYLVEMSLVPAFTSRLWIHSPVLCYTFRCVCRPSPLPPRPVIECLAGCVAHADSGFPHPIRRRVHHRHLPLCLRLDALHGSSQPFWLRSCMVSRGLIRACRRESAGAAMPPDGKLQMATFGARHSGLPQGIACAWH